MKKLFFSAICAMAFTNGFASSDVKEVIEEQVAFFGTHEQCKGIMDGVDSSQGKKYDDALKAYHECRNSTVLDEIVIVVSPKPKKIENKLTN